MLLKFQRKNLIDTSSSSQDSDDENKLNKIRLIDSPNPLIKLGVISRIKKLLDTYKDDSLEYIDKRLIRGLYLRKLKDYEEEEMLKNKIKMISLIKGKGVTTRDVITPPSNLLMSNLQNKEYSDGILHILNSNRSSTN